MSSSSSSDNLFLLRKDQQAEELLLQSESTSSNSSQTQSTAQQEAEAESCENRSESKEQKKLKLKPEEKEDKEEEEEEDDDDGFRTPTSLDHRIPEAKQCPAPPRKPKPSLKRKANSSHTSFTPSLCRRNPPPLDLSLEVELLLFQTQHHNPLSDSHQNPKKSRTHECK